MLNACMGIGHGLYVFSVFVHVIAACMWIGGMLFLILAFIPGIKNHPDKVSLIAEVSMKYRRLGAMALVLLAVTGWLQLEYRGVQWSVGYFTGTAFGKTAGLKILLFACIVSISLVHDYYLDTRAIETWKNQPDHPKTTKLRSLSRMMGRFSFAFDLLAAWLGIILARGW